MKNFIIGVIFFFIPFTLKTNIVDLKVSNSKKEEPVESDMQVLAPLIESIIKVESGGDSLAYNKAEDACGVLQIRPIMIREINNLLKCEKYTLEDRWCVSKSIEIFVTLQQFYNPELNFEKAARQWNGGRNGMNKSTTVIYFSKVNTLLNGEKCMD